MPPRKSKAPAAADGSVPLDGTVVKRTAADREEDQLAVAQAHAAGVDIGTVDGKVDRRGQIEFMGEWFRVADKVGLIPLMSFAHASSEGVDTSSMDALAAMYTMLRDCIHQGAECTCGAGWLERYPDPDNPGQLKGGVPNYQQSAANVHDDSCAWDPGDWRRFERHATKMKADADDLLPITKKVMEKLTAGPT